MLSTAGFASTSASLRVISCSFLDHREKSHMNINDLYRHSRKTVSHRLANSPSLDKFENVNMPQQIEISASARAGIVSSHDSALRDNSTQQDCGLFSSKSSPANRASSVSEISINITNENALKDFLQGIFKPHINNLNQKKFDALIEHRAARLNQKGETPKSVIETLSKGRRFDLASQATSGFARSGPFGVASRVFDTAPSLTSFAKTPAQVGAVVGIGTGVADTFGGTVMQPATLEDIDWMTAKPTELEPVMAEAYAAVEPSLWRSAVEVGAAFQAFSLRNLLRAVIAPLVTGVAGVTQAANVDSWVAAVGSPVSGAAAYLVMNQFNEAAHRKGPEYLLGRLDWEQRFDQLKNATWGTQLKGGMERAAKLPVDVATRGLQGAKDLLTATNLSKNVGALGGGIAGISTATTAASMAAKNLGVSPVGVSAIKHAVSTALFAPVVAAWTTMDVAGPSLIKKLIMYVKQITRSAPKCSEPTEGSDTEGNDIV
jgi:hypothetical protein